MKTFISYCHDDENSEKTKTSFIKSVSLVVKEYGIELWDDTKILPGDDWDEKISKNLSESSIVFVLVSQNYIASEPCINELNKAKQENKIIVPIILNDCD